MKLFIAILNCMGVLYLSQHTAVGHAGSSLLAPFAHGSTHTDHEHDESPHAEPHSHDAGGTDSSGDDHTKDHAHGFSWARSGGSSHQAIHAAKLTVLSTTSLATEIGSAVTFRRAGESPPHSQPVYRRTCTLLL